MKREGHEKRHAAVVSGHDAPVVVPTGSGKSAIHQMVALLMPGPTVVLSPQPCSSATVLALNELGRGLGRATRRVLEPERRATRAA